jgi:formylglycine-generating enzyme required for sulfatase activity
MKREGFEVAQAVRATVAALGFAAVSCPASRPDPRPSLEAGAGARGAADAARETGASRDASRDASNILKPEAAPPFDASGCTQPPVEADCSDGFCRIPAGCFVMGSPETEWHRGSIAEERTIVHLTRSFLIGQHEVTQGEWTAEGLPNPSTVFPDGTGDCLDASCPVGNVTWTEALAYANLLSQKHDPPLPPCYELFSCQKSLGQGLVCGGFRSTSPTVYECQGYRLPTQAEWEYAARAGTRTAFYSGDITAYTTLDVHPDPALERIAWYAYNSGGKTHPVGELEPNGLGLYDMSGNADEWVNDHYTGLPPSSSVDPDGTVVMEVRRATRGGLFNGLSVYCRSAAAGVASFWARGPGGGFRLARTVGGDE